MFLIEGSSISVLYTGDIRAEKWWLDSFLRSPYIIPYASGFRRLHKIYLDTTHANDSRVDSEFPSKAEGMRTLLNEVMMRPSDQKFHINTWTYGYEEALSCLAAAFSTKVRTPTLYSALLTAFC
jgi:DNA cross-link repair 1C protein